MMAPTDYCAWVTIGVYINNVNSGLMVPKCDVYVHVARLGTLHFCDASGY